MSVWHVQECRCTKVKCTTPLQIAPSATELYYTISIWYVEEWRCTQVRSNSPTTSPNCTSCYRALVHHVSLICGRISTYPGQMFIPKLIKCSALTQPYLFISIWHAEECRCTQVTYTPLTHQPKCYRALLHHVTLTCGNMQTYPAQM